MLKYKILSIRNKISYQAFMKKLTINELILQQVLSSHRRLLQEKSIPLYDPLLFEKQEVLESILHNDVSQVFIIIMKLNSITTKQIKFVDDCDELCKLRITLRELE
jgi:hypothetical protein